MIYHSVAEIYEAIDLTRAKLFDVVGSLEAGSAKARENDDGWTVEEIVEHLAIVELGMIRVIGKLLRQSESDAIASDGNLVPPASFAQFGEALRDSRVKAPEIVVPGGNRTIEESIPVLKENREKLYEMRPRLTAIDASKHTIPHPFFRELNAYQWLALVGLHERRHIGQIKRILAGQSN